MPNRPNPRPTSPKTFDVFKPGKGRPSPTSRPVIVSHQPKVQDHTVVEKQGAPVANAHPATVTTQPKPKPVLQSLAPHSAAVAHVPVPSVPRQVAPSAHAFHSAVASHHLIAHANHAPAPEPEAAEPAPKKVSRSGSTIAPPSSSAGHKLHPISINVTDHKAVKPAAPKEPEEPHLAALPITPVEAPSGLTSQKTEGKAELLAAMPIEIRRSIASDQGMSASDWDAPSAQETPAPAAPVVPAAAAPASVETAATDPAAAPAPAAPAPAAAAPAPQTAAPAPVEALTNTEPAPAKPAKVKTKGKLKKPLSFDAIIFIIMFVLFVGLGALVVLLFLSGSVKI